MQTPSKMAIEIEFYNGYIKVFGQRVDQSGTSGDWKLYAKSDKNLFGSGYITTTYYVNINYDVRIVTGTVQNEVVRAGQSSSGGYSGGGYSGSGSSGTTGTTTTPSGTTIPRTKCPNCTNGRRVYEGDVSYSGTQIRYSTCPECGLRYQSSSRTHRHGSCNTCHGSGYLD